MTDKNQLAGELLDFLTDRISEEAKKIGADSPGAEHTFWDQLSHSDAGVDWVGFGFRYVPGMVEDLHKLKAFVRRWRDHPDYRTEWEQADLVELARAERVVRRALNTRVITTSFLDHLAAVMAEYEQRNVKIEDQRQAIHAAYRAGDKRNAELLREVGRFHQIHWDADKWIDTHARHHITADIHNPVERTMPTEVLRALIVERDELGRRNERLVQHRDHLINERDQALALLHELVAGADDHRCWDIPGELAADIRDLVDRTRKDGERPTG